MCMTYAFNIYPDPRPLSSFADRHKGRGLHNPGFFVSAINHIILRVALAARQYKKVLILFSRLGSRSSQRFRA